MPPETNAHGAGMVEAALTPDYVIKRISSIMKPKVRLLQKRGCFSGLIEVPEDRPRGTQAVEMVFSSANADF